MIIPMLCIGASAEDSIWSNLKFEIFTQTYAGMNLSESDTNGMLGHASKTMRGFAVSSDGAYIFGGYLHEAGSSAVEMFDAKTGRVAGTYVHTEADGSSVSYPKGLACDDRGYLYVGLANRKNKGFASMAVVKYDEKGDDGWLKEVSRNVFINVDESTKIGVNGVAVYQNAGKYYLYIIVNYDVDYLYRMDVTDPANPVIDTTFGSEGRIDLQGSKYDVNDANYLDIGEDGMIYIGYKGNSVSGLMVLSPDGKDVIKTIAQNKGYAVRLWENYILVSTQSGPTSICVYDKTTYDLVASFQLTNDNVTTRFEDLTFDGMNSIVGIEIVNDVLYIGDQTGSLYDQILMAPLTVVGEPIVNAYIQVLTDRFAQAATTAPETTKAPETEAPETKAPETEAPETEAPETAAPETNAPETKAPETEAPAASSGCGSSVAYAAVAIVAVLGTAVVFKKK